MIEIIIFDNNGTRAKKSDMRDVNDNHNEALSYADSQWGVIQYVHIGK